MSPNVNIKGLDPKRLTFNKVITVTGEAQVTKVLFDRASEGDMCAITCNHYNGVTSKWSDFEVSLQPFENFCMFFTGCSSQWPLPSQTVTLIVGQSRYELKQTQPETLGYYLPLAARKAIAREESPLAIEIAGVKMPIYRIGEQNRSLLRSVVNQEDELDTASPVVARSKAERLSELRILLEAKQISKAEYDTARAKILAD